MNELIEKIQEVLEESIPELNYIGEDLEQMENEEDFDRIDFPCVLLDLQESNFTGMGDRRQQGTLVLAVKVFPFAPNDNLEEKQQAARTGWHICREIVKLLHGQNILPESYGKPVRRQMGRVIRNDGIYERDIIFEIGFNDTAGLRPWTTTPAGVEIETAIKYT